MDTADRVRVRAAQEGGRVLVVDDNPATRYASARVLKAAGFQTCEAATGAEALALADSGVIAVILDIHLPDMNGFEICSILRRRAHLESVPVIHLSAAYMMDDDKVRGLEGGADAYMTHPADPPLLVATVNALVRARRAEQGMRTSEARFRAIYDFAPSGIALIDATGRITEANSALLDLLKRPMVDVVNRPLSSFAPPGDAARVQAIVAGAALQNWRGDFPLIDAQSRQLDVEWSLSAHVEPGVVLAIATDVSDRMDLARRRDALLEREQAARAEAERTSRMKDEFIAVLSHELRTPLNAILTWAQLLQRSTTQLPRGLSVIERNARIQTRLIADILDVSRMGMGKLSLDLAVVDPEEVVRTAVEVLQTSAADKQVTMQTDLQPLSQPFVADAARLQQIIWNLVTNAIKFSGQGGRVEIVWRAAGANAELIVRDEGRGIQPEFLPHLFDRFAQSDAASNRLHGGLGLGLSIVKHLAELHGGTASARSGGLGQGAEFSVLLPLHRSAALPVSGLPEPASVVDDHQSTPRLAGIDVLLVEDDVDAREIAALILRDNGARVTEAADYASALARLAESSPHVLVSDIGLPGADGYELMREIRRRERDGAGSTRVRAVALTAFARAQDRTLAFSAGFDAHCTKPLQPIELLNAIRPVVGESAVGVQDGDGMSRG